MLIACLLLSIRTDCYSEPPFELGEEYTDYEKTATKNPESGYRWLWYLPNRVLDLVDVFRLDVGVGPSFGAVARVTKWGQVGYRNLNPLSLRVGLRGRRLPIFVEHTSEFGIGPAFFQSPSRDITPLEVGGGVDLLIAGIHGGISIDEAFDFIAGIFGFDPIGDDY